MPALIAPLIVVVLAQAPQRDLVAAAPRAGVISGRVVDASTAAPLRNARVGLVPEQGEEPDPVLTDSDGHFAIADVPRPGTARRRRPDGRRRDVQAGPGSTRDDLGARCERRASGGVREPVVRRARRPPWCSPLTFDVRGLPTGDYFVIAIPRLSGEDWQDPALLDALSATAVRRLVAEGENLSLGLKPTQLPRR